MTATSILEVRDLRSLVEDCAAVLCGPSLDGMELYAIGALEDADMDGMSLVVDGDLAEVIRTVGHLVDAVLHEPEELQVLDLARLVQVVDCVRA